MTGYHVQAGLQARALKGAWLLDYFFNKNQLHSLQITEGRLHNKNFIHAFCWSHQEPLQNSEKATALQTLCCPSLKLCILFTAATVLCPSLDPPSNGNVSVSSNFVGDRVYYWCNTGYRFSRYYQLSRLYRTCQLSGNWSGTEPTCFSEYFETFKMVVITILHDVIYTGACGYLPHPRYGRVFVNTLVVGGRATYICSRGFRVVGPTTRTCLSDGSWSGSQPICNRMLISLTILYNDIKQENHYMSIIIIIKA